MGKPRPRRLNRKRLALKEPIMDPLCEVKLSDLVGGQHYNVLLRKQHGVEHFFMSRQNYRMHYMAQKKYRERYVAGLLVLHQNDVKLEPAVLYFALAAAWGRYDNELVEALLSIPALISAAEVLKALSILDIGRRVRAAHKRVKRLETSKTDMIKYKLPDAQELKMLDKLKPETKTASGAVMKRVRRWVSRLSEDDLRQYVKQMEDKEGATRKVWRRLADICHFNPTRHFAALPWFLPYCYGEHKLPSTPTFDLRALNVNQYVLDEDVPFDAIEKAGLLLCLRPEAKARLATYTDLDTVLSHVGDLLCPETEEVLCQRLATEGDKLGVENHIPLIGPILSHIVKVLKVRMNNPTEMVRLQTDDEDYFEATYEQADADVGTHVLESLTGILDRRLAATREMLSPHLLGHTEVICDNNAEGEQENMVWGAPQDKSTSLQPALMSATLAALTGARLYGAERTAQEEREGLRPCSGAEVVALGQAYTTGHLKMGQGAGYIRRLTEEQRAVEVIVLVIKPGVMMAPVYFDEFVESLEKYSADVYPTCLVVVHTGRVAAGLQSKLKASTIRYLEFKTKSLKGEKEAIGAIDAIVRVVRSSATCLRTLDEQTGLVVGLVKEHGVKGVFTKVFGEKTN